MARRDKKERCLVISGLCQDGQKVFFRLLMMEFQGVRDGYLQLGVVILGLPVQMDPDAGHGKRMSRLGLGNVWNWNTLEER